MGGKFGQDKGKRAEREAVRLLQPVVINVYSSLGCPEDQIPLLQRNTIQAHKGGYDMVGLEWMALEVKHQERLLVNDWWQQTVDQAQGGKEPILFYKQNNIKFRVVMLGEIQIHRKSPRKVRTPVEISMDAFLIYFRERLFAELGYIDGWVQS